MPRYDFECKKCKTRYDDFALFDEKDKYPSVICPKCGSRQKTRLISLCNFNFADPVGTDRYNGSHDYRFHHKLPSVLAERQAAEEAAAGQISYQNIDDLNIDAAWKPDGSNLESDIQLS